MQFGEDKCIQTFLEKSEVKKQNYRRRGGGYRFK
jgi:hypothetical protein